jgi:predicted alpha-1,2-mannosidase
MTERRPSPTRRTFLQTATAGMLSTALPSPAAAQNASSSTHKAAIPAGAADPQRLTELVNIFQGTESSRVFSRGNTLPIVAAPFGMAHWTIQTSSDSGAWFFDPTKRRIEGIRCTHQLSPWLNDYGQAVFFPYAGESSLDPATRASSYRPEDTKSGPHHLDLTLARSSTRLELTATERCAVLRLTFSGREEKEHSVGNTGPGNTGLDNAGLIIDLAGTDAKLERRGNLLLATVHANSGGVAPGFATYYVLECDTTFADFAPQAVKTQTIAKVPFALAPGQAVVNLRIGTSFISHEQAERNLHTEALARTFDDLLEANRKVWNSHLSRALIEGGTTAQQRTFYSCMYRALLFPRIWHEPDATGQPQHWSPYTGKLTPGLLYADHGYWDVYRVWYPWISILFPERLSEMLQSWVNAGKEGGWLPQFPCPGYRACMTGSLIDAVFGDAAAKGIGGFDLETAYDLLKKHATQPGDPAAGYGRRGIEDYLKLHYCSTDHVDQACAETVDAAYGDFCIAQVARALHKLDDAKMFEARSEYWRNVYDPATKFLRGRKSDGTFEPTFDPFRWGDPYVEGSAWQHRFDVPHQPEELFAAMGGNAYAASQLELMCTLPPIFDVGVYGQEIHEMSEMAAVNFGQYAHSNQPVHHVLYLFAIAGRRDRLQYWVRRVLTELYTPDTFAGDEDTGSMAAWFLMSAVGFSPICPSRAEYILGAPLFDRVTLTVANGAKTVIEARNQSPENVYASSITMDGHPHPAIAVSHADIRRGCRLLFAMSSSVSVTDNAKA